MVGAHISVSVLETPRTLDSFFPPVDETQPRRWAKALLRRQAAPMPRAARQSSATGRLPDGTLLAVPHFLSPLPPLVPLNEGHRSFPARLGVALVVPPWRQRAPGQFWCAHGSSADSDPCRRGPGRDIFPTDKFSGKVGKLLGFWASGRIVEELWKNGVVAYRSPTFLGGRVKFPFSFSELSSETAVVQHNQGFCCREVCLHW